MVSSAAVLVLASLNYVITYPVQPTTETSFPSNHSGVSKRDIHDELSDETRMAIENPSILICDPYIIFRAESRFTVNCFSTAGSPLEVFWYFDGKRIFASGSRPQTISKDNNITLTITNAKASDAGTYSCLATLLISGKPQTVSGSVVTESRPFLTALPKSIYTDAGDFTSIYCEEVGSHGITFSWLVRAANGSDVPFTSDDPRVEIVNDDHSSSIIFHRVDYPDRSHYTCQVQNLAGQDSSTTYLRVKNPLRWIWPLIGVGACLLVTFFTLSISAIWKRTFPRLRFGRESDTSLAKDTPESPSRMIVLLNDEERLLAALPKMLETGKKHNYPTSVMIAAIKWKAATETRKIMGKPFPADKFKKKKKLTIKWG